MKPYVIITGASQGLGRCLAVEFAKLKYNLILVSRNNELLSQLKSEICEITDNNIEVHILSLDLSVNNNIDYLFEYIESKELSVEILINNAAIADYKQFKCLSFDQIKSCIDLNIIAFTNILSKFINLKSINKKYILNISSSYAFKQAKNYSVYGATKSFVYYLSLSLKSELNDKTHISVFCPGKLKTNFDKNSGKQNPNFYEGISPEYAAKYAISKMFKGSFLIIPGLKNKLIRLISILFPEFYSKIYEKTQR